MLETTEIIHSLTVAIATAIPAIGVGFGQGSIGLVSAQALNFQPMAKDDIQKTSILGMALVETAAIIGTCISLILIIGSGNTARSLYTSISEIGIAIAIGLTGLIIGIASSMPAKSACLSLAKQPFQGNQILRFMLITQSVIQTPIIFSFIVAMFIKNMSVTASTLEQGLSLLASGLAIGLGTVGPALGLGRLSSTACTAIGSNKKAYSKIFTFTLISEAIIETPVIFSLLTSLLIISTHPTTTLKAIALVSAAFCIGVGTFGPGLSSGNISSEACTQIAKDPNKYSLISNVSIFSQSIIETSAIYAFMVSLLLILK